MSSKRDSALMSGALRGVTLCLRRRANPRLVRRSLFIVQGSCCVSQSSWVSFLDSCCRLSWWGPVGPDRPCWSFWTLSGFLCVLPPVAASYLICLVNRYGLAGRFGDLSVPADGSLEAFLVSVIFYIAWVIPPGCVVFAHTVEPL